MTKNLILCPLIEDDIDEIVSSFKMIGWNKPKSIYESYLNEQSHNIRSVIIAKENGKFCGYVTIKWKSEYPLFSQENIPEISDLNVLPHFRKNGIGTTLINASEALAKERGHSSIGLGVGMTADYGNAQRLYVHLGYVPDGHGLHYKNKPLNHGDQASIDDDLVIYLSRSI